MVVLKAGLSVTPGFTGCGGRVLCEHRGAAPPALRAGPCRAAEFSASAAGYAYRIKPML